MSGEWVQTGTIVGLTNETQDTPGGPSGDQHIYANLTVYAENWDLCGWYHFHTYGPVTGNHRYSVDYAGFRQTTICHLDAYIFGVSMDDQTWDVAGLWASAARADANIETHNPQGTCLTDAGSTYFGTDNSGAASADYGLHLYDGTNWLLWTRQVDNPWIYSGAAGTPPYQYDRLNTSVTDYYSFKAGTQDPQDPDDDNDSRGITDGSGRPRFRDEVEDFLGTRSFDACSDDNVDLHPPHANPPFDAWPPDFKQDRVVDILDVLMFRPKLWPNPYDRRYDLNTDGTVDIMDVLIMRPYIGLSCP
jgi:hypothetical protein